MPLGRVLSHQDSTLGRAAERTSLDDLQLDPTVLGAAVRGVVARDRLRLAEPTDGEARIGDAILDEVLLHGGRPSERELQVVLIAADR